MIISLSGRFYPSDAKAISDAVIVEVLNGQEYDEEEAKTWSMDISDRIRELVTGDTMREVIMIARKGLI